MLHLPEGDCQSFREAGWRFLLPVCVAVLLAPPALGQPTPSNWQAEVRARVMAKELGSALAIVEQRLAEARLDLEARGWRARLLAWSGRWSEAEADYRKVLEAAPQDADILLGLADLMAWQHRFDEALVLIGQAQEQDPRRPDVYNRRGRSLRSLGRFKEAREAFRRALELDPANAEAQAGWASLRPEPRHEYRMGTDLEAFNFAPDAQSVTASLRSRLSSHWSSSFAANFQHRFSQQAGRFLGSATYRPNRHAAFTLGGGAGPAHDVLPQREFFFEYSPGAVVRAPGLIRGVELVYRQDWLWFRSARVLLLVPSAVVYFPRGWFWSVSVDAARSRFPTTSAEWRPSGSTRLVFPLAARLTGHLLFAVGTENFAQADQVGRFSARTWGGGASCKIRARQDAAFDIFHQDRSRGRSETGYGFSYGIRF